MATCETDRRAPMRPQPGTHRGHCPTIRARFVSVQAAVYGRWRWSYEMETLFENSMCRISGLLLVVAWSSTKIVRR